MSLPKVHQLVHANHCFPPHQAWEGGWASIHLPHPHFWFGWRSQHPVERRRNISVVNKYDTAQMSKHIASSSLTWNAARSVPAASLRLSTKASSNMSINISSSHLFGTVFGVVHSHETTGAMEGKEVTGGSTTITWSWQIFCEVPFSAFPPNGTSQTWWQSESASQVRGTVVVGDIVGEAVVGATWVLGQGPIIFQTPAASDDQGSYPSWKHLPLLVMHSWIWPFHVTWSPET